MDSQASGRYLATAFYSQYNLILLGGSALFSLASASLWPIGLAGAVEALWLGVGPKLPVLRRRVDRRAEDQRRARFEQELADGMSRLSQESATRLRGVGQSISWISMRADSVALDPLEREALLELELLRPAFLRLCQLRERVQQRREEFRQAPPAAELAELSRRYSLEKDLGERFTLHQAVKAAQKKLEYEARLGEVQRQVELKLTIVEQTLVQLRGQQQLGLSSADLAREVQGIVSQVAEIGTLESELEA